MADRQQLGRWGRYADAITRWEHIIGRAALVPTVLNNTPRPMPAAEFVEWLMALPDDWICASIHDLTAAQRLAALGNGVRPLQAVRAITLLSLVAYGELDATSNMNRLDPNYGGSAARGMSKI